MFKTNRKIVYAKKNRCRWCRAPITKDSYSFSFCSRKCLKEHKENEKRKQEEIKVPPPIPHFRMDEESGRLVARTLWQEELDELKKEEE